MAQTQTRTTTYECDLEGCNESMTISDNQPITEALAIELGSWLTVAGQRVTPEGIVVDAKHFCSAECLADYVNPLVAEYKAAEDRVLTKQPTPDLQNYYSPEAKAALSAEIDSWEKLNEEEDKPNLEALQAAAFNTVIPPVEIDYDYTLDQDLTDIIDAEAEQFNKDMAPKGNA